MSTKVEKNGAVKAFDFLNMELIRRFVRQDLGCTCPEDVFDDVVVGCPGIYKEIPLSKLQMVVGRRVLVSVSYLQELSDPFSDVRRTLLKGKEIRDTNGFNRFRLVLLGAAPDEILSKLRALPGSIDDRVHLHYFSQMPK